MVRGNLRNLTGIVVLQLTNITHNLTLVGTNGGEQQEILKILVFAKGRRLDDNFLQKFNELNREVGLEEGFNSDRYIIRVGAFRKSSCNKL